MHLDVIGAGPAYTDRPGATGAAYLVRAAGSALLLDLGQGSLPQLFGKIDPADVDAIVISHLHPDHFIDLVPLRHYLRYEFDPPRRMRVIAPRELGDRLDALHAEPGFTAQALDVEPLAAGDRTVGSLGVRAARVAHTADSYAFRITGGGGGPALVYSGDCGRADDLRPLIMPGDVLLSEISFGAGPVPPDVLHLDGPAIARLATTAGVGRVLLTHLQIGHDPDAALASVRASYDGPVSFVWPGTDLEI